MNTLPLNIDHITIGKVRKDGAYKDAVEKVRTLINEDRKGTKWKSLSYMAVKMKLDRAGYNNDGRIYMLLGSVRDAKNPVSLLFYKLKV